jgi:hypothetical protein
MEWVGEGSRQMFGEDVWVRRWFDVHNDEVLAGTNLVFDDVRNNVEASAIRRAGGRVFRIFNDRADALPILPSEKYLDTIQFDMTIVNFETPEFHDNVRALMRAYDVRAAVRPLWAPDDVEAPIGFAATAKALNGELR